MEIFLYVLIDEHLKPNPSSLSIRKKAVFSDLYDTNSTVEDYHFFPKFKAFK